MRDFSGQQIPKLEAVALLPKERAQDLVYEAKESVDTHPADRLSF